MEAHDQVVADPGELAMRIEARAAELRETADLPDTFEAELAERFDSLVPPDPAYRLPDTINSIRAMSTISVEVPVESSRFPPLRVPKSAVRMATSWYLRFVADQVSGVGRATAEALDLIEIRLRRLEHQPAPRPSPIESGPVSADIDALLAERDHDGPVVRVESLADLAALPRGGVGAIGVTTLAESMDAGRVEALVEQTQRTLRTGGLLVISSPTPAAWSRTDPLEADLAGRRPLHAESWVTLLDREGFDPVRAQLAPDSYVVTATKGHVVTATKGR